MALMRGGHLENMAHERGAGEPVGQAVAEDSVAPGLMDAVIGLALAGDDENQPELACRRRKDESRQRRMRTVGSHAVEIETLLGVDAATPEPVEPAAIHVRMGTLEPGNGIEGNRGRVPDRRRRRGCPALLRSPAAQRREGRNGRA